MLINEPLAPHVVVVSVAIVVVVIIVASTLDAFSSSIVFKILVSGTTYVMIMNFWFIFTTKVEMPYIEGVPTTHTIFIPASIKHKSTTNNKQTIISNGDGDGGWT